MYMYRNIPSFVPFDRGKRGLKPLHFRVSPIFRYKFGGQRAKFLCKGSLHVFIEWLASLSFLCRKNLPEPCPKKGIQLGHSVH